MVPTSAAAGDPAVVVRLCLIDGFRLSLSGESVDVPPGARRLIALLAVVGPRPRRAAAGALWPEGSEARAGGNLRSTVWRVKRICPGLITCADQELRLGPQVEVDTSGFVRQMRRLVVDEGPLPGEEVEVDVDQIHELLPGWAEDWVAAERERLRLLNLHALESLSRRLLAGGHHLRALEAALTVVASEPLRESGHRAVIAVHVAEGNLAEARRHYDQLTELFQRELGVLPTTQTARLVGR